MSRLVSPYINTKLYTSVLLHPHQMNNKLYINLKRNLEKVVSGKCFSKYGYIVKVIEIIEYNEGIIEAENVESSARFPVSFSCRLCAPLKNIQIIAKIDKINKHLVTANNGPIVIIITNDRVNDEVFFKDNKNDLRYKKNNQSVLLQPNDYIKITLQSIQFHDGDDKIKAIGFIDDMATSKEIKLFYENKEIKEDEDIIEYKEYEESVLV